MPESGGGFAIFGSLVVGCVNGGVEMHVLMGEVNVG